MPGCRLVAFLWTEAGRKLQTQLRHSQFVHVVNQWFQLSTSSLALASLDGREARVLFRSSYDGLKRYQLLALNYQFLCWMISSVFPGPVERIRSTEEMGICGLEDNKILVASITVLSASLADDGGPLPAVQCSLVLKDSVNDLSRQPNDLQRWASTSIVKVNLCLKLSRYYAIATMHNKHAS